MFYSNLVFGEASKFQKTSFLVLKTWVQGMILSSSSSSSNFKVVDRPNNSEDGVVGKIDAFLQLALGVRESETHMTGYYHWKIVSKRSWITRGFWSGNLTRDSSTTHH